MSGEARELLQTAKAEILNLRSNITKAKLSTAGYKRDIQSMERKIYTFENIELLKTDKQKRKAMKLCEGNLPKYKIKEIIEGIRNGK